MPKELQWTRELINAFWDGVAQTPLTELSFARLSGPKLLDYIDRHLPPTVKCLDFGSGDGDLIALLVERGCQAAAFEPSQGRRQELMEKPFAKSQNFLGVVDDTSSQTFDVVIAAEVLEHVLDDELPSIVDRLRRFLHTDGTLIVTTPNSEDLDWGIAYCPVSDLVFHRWQHLRSFTAESLDECLSAGGFRRIEDHRVDFSSYGELSEQLDETKRRLKQLQRENRKLRRFGPLYTMFAPLVRSRDGDENRNDAPADLRIGSETNLIYVGKAV